MTIKTLSFTGGNSKNQFILLVNELGGKDQFTTLSAMNDNSHMMFKGEWEFLEFVAFCKEIGKYFEDYDSDGNFGGELVIRETKKVPFKTQ